MHYHYTETHVSALDASPAMLLAGNWSVVR